MICPPPGRFDFGNLRCILPEAKMGTDNQDQCREQRSQLHFSVSASTAPLGIRPYKVVNSLSLLASSSVRSFSLNRHRQLSEVLLGRFMRASEPNPSTSCKGTMAVFATDASTARMKSQWILSPSVPRYFRQTFLSHSICSAVRVEPSPGTLLNQPTVVSLS